MAQVQQAIGNGQRAVTLRRSGLTMQCFFSEHGRLRRKIERRNGATDDFVYQFDEKEHLLTVLRNGCLEERYQYNEAGQRIQQWRREAGVCDFTAGGLHYDKAGRLTGAGSVYFSYDQKGALSERRGGREVFRFSYGGNTMLDKVVLPSGEVLRYEYDKANPIGPARRFRNKNLAAEYVWRDPLRLAVYRDYEDQLEYTFWHDKSGLLDRVRILAAPEQSKPVSGSRDYAEESMDWLNARGARNRRERLQGLFAEYRGKLDLFCGCDQVGTLKILTTSGGRVIKETTYDSFGVVRHDSCPDLFLPIGFAGGFQDRDTGLVRFGYRDYEPSIGRFTAPDPLGDTGGDHDLYDYCIDDPVSMSDPTGLIAPIALFAAGKLGALALAGMGAYASAWMVDKMKNRQGIEGMDAVDALNQAAPHVGKAWWDSTFPGRLIMGNPATQLGTQIMTHGRSDSRGSGE